MTISNHSPYQIPENYKAYPLQLPAKTIYPKTNTDEQVKKNLLSYQYANDCLGKFIHKIRTSALGRNTIIVATGDHNAKAVFDFSNVNYFQLNAVPCLYYIPNYYRPTQIDTSIFTNHTDIIPSLVQLSLSKAFYPNFGISVFTKTADSAKHLAINFEDEWVANKNGLCVFKQPMQYYNWLDAGRTKTIASDTVIRALQPLAKKVKALFASSILLIQNELAADTIITKPRR
jgi:phosphoglycerol transferase MdoB-like AlkP superfamily enzyme